MATLNRNERLSVWAAVALFTISGWWYVADMAVQSSPHIIPTPAAMMEASRPAWLFSDFLMIGLMWIIMMVAMMLPTSVRSLMAYARIPNPRYPGGVLPSYLFLAGYMLVWSGFSLLATLLHWRLDLAGLMTKEIRIASDVIGGPLIILAGLYQFTHVKKSCLLNCQSPAASISRACKEGRTGALMIGMQQGVYCLGCCWLLMLMLFVAGVMNLLWMALLTLFVLAEKTVPALWPRINRWFTFASGASLIFAGFWLLDNALLTRGT